MRTRPKLPAALPQVERLLKWNLVIAVAMATMLRASFEFSEAGESRPSGIVMLAFFVAMGLAVFAIVRLKAAIGLVPHRWWRIAIAVVSLAGHAVLLQVLVARFAP